MNKRNFNSNGSETIKELEVDLYFLWGWIPIR